MLIQKPVIEELFRVTAAWCKKGNNSFADLMAGQANFG
jgi:hypothetical protein